MGRRGRRYIDFAAGIAVANVGHSHPKVVAAAREQAERFIHTSFQVSPYEPYIAVCERINALAPFKGKAKTFLVNSGAEAVENTVKVARAATGRAAIIAFSGGFHGRTLATTALTGKVFPYKAPFGPMMPDVFHVPFPVPSEGITAAQSLAHLKTLFRADVAPSRVAGIIIEPIQGEGGFYEAPLELLQGLRAICDEHGILLIADEVQSGCARTGAMFAIEHAGVEPDLVAFAKGIAGGFPLGGVVGRAELIDAVPAGGLGSTFGGNPVSCAAAVATLDVIAEEKLNERALAIGERLIARLDELSRRNDVIPIRNLRGRGAMIAFDVVGESGAPDAAGAQRLAKAALTEGLFLLTCGINGNSIRILSPLTIEMPVLDEGLDMLARAMMAANPRA